MLEGDIQQDDWVFSGPVTSQYKQIGNAVPVNLGFAVGRSLVALLNKIESKTERFEIPEVKKLPLQMGLFEH